ncbi:MAG: glycosyltransferase [Ilumatobacteraceae bacterium]
MTVPRRYLMPMWEGGGTLPPELGVARRLIARGHSVHVLGDPTISEQAQAAGCSFSPWRRAPHRTSLDPAQDPIKDWETSNPLTMIKRVCDRFIAGPAHEYAADTADAIAAVRPDAVVPDFLLFGAIIAAQAAELPVAPLVPQIWALPTKGAPAFGAGFPLAKGVIGKNRDALMQRVVNRLFNNALPTLNAARRANGLAPLRSFYDQVLDTDQILVLSSPTFDFASPFVPANVTYVGPILDDPTWAEPWQQPWPASNQDPLVLVGFSSTFQDQAPLLKRVIEALSAMPVRAVVTIGQMIDAHEMRSTDNVAVVQSAPHESILRQASLTVTHAGHGTVMKSLAAGVPMVCIPMGRDQNDNAARVVHHGAGIRLRTRASTAQIAAAVHDVLAGPHYRTSAQRLATAISEEADATDLTTPIEALVHHHRQHHPATPNTANSTK